MPAVFYIYNTITIKPRGKENLGDSGNLGQLYETVEVLDDSWSIKGFLYKNSVPLFLGHTVLRLRFSRVVTKRYQNVKPSPFST